MTDLLLWLLMGVCLGIGIERDWVGRAGGNRGARGKKAGGEGKF